MADVKIKKYNVVDDMNRKFCDLHIYADMSANSGSVKDIIMQAEQLDLFTIALIDYVKENNKDCIGQLRDEIKKVKTKVKVLAGVMIDTGNPEILKKQIKRLRDKADILIVSGGLSKINRAAVEDLRVDILAHPELGRRDSGIDKVMAKLAADNFVAIEFNFRNILHTYRKLRTHTLTHMRINAALAEKYGTPTIITSGARNTLDMRAGRDLASLGVLAEMELTHSLDSVSYLPCKLIEHIRNVKSDNYIMPGAKIIRKNNHKKVAR